MSSWVATGSSEPSLYSASNTTTSPDSAVASKESVTSSKPRSSAAANTFSAVTGRPSPSRTGLPVPLSMSTAARRYSSPASRLAYSTRSTIAASGPAARMRSPSAPSRAEVPIQGVVTTVLSSMMVPMSTVTPWRETATCVLTSS